MGRYTIHKRQRQRQRHWRKLKLVGFIVFVISVGFGWAWLDTVSINQSSDTSLTDSPPDDVAAQGSAVIELEAAMPWPDYGYSAYAKPGLNLFASSSPADMEPVPIASLAKIITSLAIVDKHPLAADQPGPVITYNQKDVDLFYEYLAKDGIVVPVQIGAEVSLQQALQAIMMVSANNMADMAVERVFGSMDEYVAYANDMLNRFGLTKTTVSDASGFSPQTVSTPREMATLTGLYLQHPLLRQIALTPSVEFPVAGAVDNANSFANQDGIIGIKTGFIEAAGRTFIMADLAEADRTGEVSVAVVLGAEDFITAAYDAIAILRAGNTAAEQVQL